LHRDNPTINLPFFINVKDGTSLEFQQVTSAVVEIVRMASQYSSSTSKALQKITRSIETRPDVSLKAFWFIHVTASCIFVEMMLDTDDSGSVPVFFYKTSNHDGSKIPLPLDNMEFQRAFRMCMYA